MEFHFFVFSFCRVDQGAKTNKRQNAKTKLYFFVLSRCTSPKNEEMEFHFFFFSFCRLPTKRQSYCEISKFYLSWLLVRFVVCSFCRLPQGAKTTERQRDKMRFCGHFVLSFVRFVALCKSPKRRNEMAVSGFHSLVSRSLLGVVLMFEIRIYTLFSPSLT